MIGPDVDRKTIAILLAMVVPGAGHVYYSPSKRRKGFGIAVLFVVLNLINIYSYSLINLIELNFVPGLFFTPMVIVWALQLRSVMRFTDVQVMSQQPK